MQHVPGALTMCLPARQTVSTPHRKHSWHVSCTESIVITYRHQTTSTPPYLEYRDAALLTCVCTFNCLLSHWRGFAAIYSSIFATAVCAYAARFHTKQDAGYAELSMRAGPVTPCILPMLVVEACIFYDLCCIILYDYVIVTYHFCYHHLFYPMLHWSFC